MSTESNDWLMRERALLQAAADQAAAALQEASVEIREWRERAEKFRKAENEISAAYVRLRTLIPGALDTPQGPTPKQVYDITERALRAVMKQIS